MSKKAWSSTFLAECTSDTDQRECKQKEEGIPTVFTPVPSDASFVLAEHKRRALPRGCPSLVLTTTSARTPTVSESGRVIRLVLVKVHFMQKFYTSFELPTDQTLVNLVRFVVKSISREISNKFSFYLYASPYDVIWRRPRCELMQKPPRSNIFRQMLTPSQANQTLGSVIADMKSEGVDTLNVHFFVKNMEDDYVAKDGNPLARTWKFQQVLDL
ncbi:unnamed protein product [Caenorhabditis sp. 36 PRJEB53466]|nr:unnamed protein product [Caenorhabditis sp. 36 PRJEB53466]